MILYKDIYLDRWGYHHEPHRGTVVSQRFGSYGAITADGRCLFICPDQEAGIYELPGGNVRSNENPKIGLVREIRKETGLLLPNVSFTKAYEQQVKVFDDRTKEFWHHFQSFFRAELPADSPFLFNGRQHIGSNAFLAWIPVRDIKKVRIHHIHALALRRLALL